MSMERFNDLIKTNKKGSLTNSIIGPLISSEQLKLKGERGEYALFPKNPQLYWLIKQDLIFQLWFHQHLHLVTTM